MAAVGLFVESRPGAISPRLAAVQAFVLPAVLSPTENTFVEVHRPNEAFGGKTTLIDY
jgi:hypothetical protein